MSIRVSFKYDIGEMVYVSLDDAFFSGEVKVQYRTATGNYYNIRTRNGRVLQWHESKIAKSPTALGAKLARLAKQEADNAE